MSGLILILCEFYLPGAILGILGAIALLAAVFLYASQTSSLFSILLFIGGVILAAVLTIRFAIWRIIRAKPDKSIYSNANQEGFQASAFDKSTIGKTGRVLTDLKPGGFIRIDGKQHAAISISGYIAKGEDAIVVGGQEQSLMVKKSHL